MSKVRIRTVLRITRTGLTRQTILPKKKVLGRAVHCLGRIGEDLYLEPQSDGLALRTMNSARSAFTSFLFCPQFFTSYSQTTKRDERGEGDDEGKNANCKLPLKVSPPPFRDLRIPLVANLFFFSSSLFQSVYSVFRSISALERTVESADIEIEPSKDQVL